MKYQLVRERCQEKLANQLAREIDTSEQQQQQQQQQSL
jgi:transcriptional regulator GlxA family with amidase domain